MSYSFETAHDVLKKYWGYQEFRPVQEDIIKDILAGNDLLAILPTGGGKSICFQLPALLQSGITLVISPLIALINDQVSQLADRGIPAAAIHSGMNRPTFDRIMDNAISRMYKILYISPERLQNERFQHQLMNMQINTVAVDEAHCISQWGHDFRPSYLEISSIRRIHPEVQIVAFTATATEKVQFEVAELLELKHPKIHRKSITREELEFQVWETADKDHTLLTLCQQKLTGPRIIYTRSRKKTERLSLFLKRRG